MAIQLKFEKSNSESWGFRLTGGVEYDVPLTVVKVTENSIAECGGLLKNDIIVRVNDTPTAGLTHSEAHDLLISAGNNLTLAVRREHQQLNSFVTNYDESREEISNITQAYSEGDEHIEHQNETCFAAVKFINEEPVQEMKETATEISLEKQIEESMSVTVQKTTSEIEEPKWSTFLQKPRNPKPLPKKTEEPVKGEPYRVVIKKQKKKSREDVKAVQLENNVQHSTKEEENVTDVLQESNIVNGEQQITLCTEITEEEQIEFEEDDYNENITVTEESIQTEDQKKRNVISEKILEEKLAEVQKQLEALSQLPTTIQLTIDAVSKQLASIVSAKTTHVTESEEFGAQESLEIDLQSESDLAEQTVTEESNVSINGEGENFEKEENREIQYDDDDGLKPVAEDDTEIKQEILEIIEEQTNEEIDPDEGLTEEEKEARRLEQEFLAKQQKERAQLEEFKQRRLEQRPTLPLKPIERPIILPGGRRWSQPDDACPVVKHPKMSDEKIANTIETYSELLVGKTKGESNSHMVPSSVISTKKINFLKYQPPPKNLDYLHKSDVYKLVHDLEPPVKGISSRVCKILSEQDYYQAG